MGRIHNGYPRLATNLGVVMDGSAGSRPGSRAPVRARQRRVHSHQIIGAQGLTPLFSRRTQDGPVLRRDALPVAPLANNPVGLTDISGELGDRLPQIKHVRDAFHPDVIAMDRLSSQAEIINPVTEPTPHRTIRPMGRGTSSQKFVDEFCRRVAAAREFAGLSQSQVAKQLGISTNTWSKYETRTLLPHRYIPTVCRILHVKADYFYGADPWESTEIPPRRIGSS